MTELWRREKPLVAFIGVMTAVYSVLSVMKHRHFQSNAIDFGNFVQMAWNYARWRAPACTQLGLPNALGDHFSPILAALAPLLWVAPRAETLLVAQVVLIASACVPIFLYCERKGSRASAYLLTASFAVFWGTQNVVWTDFHPDAFAVPLIAWAVYLVDRKDWGRACAAVLALLLVKEELSVLVSFFGLLALLDGRRRLGLALFAAGTAAFYLQVMVLIPRLRAGTTFAPEWLYPGLGPTPAAAVVAVLTEPLKVLGLLFSERGKLQAYLLLLGPFLFLPLLSRLTLLLLPLLAVKTLTSNPNMWSFETHYSAFLCPLLVMACADGMSRFKAPSFVPWLILGVNLALIPRLTRWKDAASADFWRFNETERTGAQALALVPPEAAVLTQSSIAPHLALRETVFSLDNDDCGRIRADYFVANRELNAYPSSYREVAACMDEKRAEGFQTVFEKDGWTVLKR